MSQKEIVYTTGVSDAELRDMTKRVSSARNTRKCVRAPDFSEVPAPRLRCFPAQQQAYDGMAALMDENAPRCGAAVWRDRQRQDAGIPAADRARARAGKERHCARARNWT